MGHIHPPHSQEGGHIFSDTNMRGVTSALANPTEPHTKRRCL